MRRQINPKLRIDGILLTMVDSRTNYAREVSALLRGHLRQQAESVRVGYSAVRPGGGDQRRGQEHLRTTTPTARLRQRTGN